MNKRDKFRIIFPVLICNIIAFAAFCAHEMGPIDNFYKLAIIVLFTIPNVFLLAEITEP